jgi:hypothetical protein
MRSTPSPASLLLAFAVALAMLWPGPGARAQPSAPSPSLAPAPSPSASTWTLTISQSENSLVHEPQGLGEGELAADTTLEIRCRRPIDCRSIELYPIDRQGKPGATLMPAQRAERRSARYLLALADLQGMESLAVRHRPWPAKSILLRAVAAELESKESTPAPAQPALPDDVSAILARQCAEIPAFVTYDRAANQAQVVVTPTGMALTALPGHLDEDDTVVVTVLADARLLPFVEVRRTSPQRSIGDLRILGDDVTLPKDPFQRQSERDAACEAMSVRIGDLAPGKAEIELAVRTSRGRIVTGTIELRVHPLYTGMFSLGPLWTEVADPEFGLVTRDMETIVSAREQDSGRMLLAFFYTPFVWGKRDIDKPVARWYHHVNPTLGVALPDPLHNVLAGASVAGRGFVLTAGVHVARVRALDDASGLAAGDAFMGDEDDLPVTHEWTAAPFVSVAVDLRAALKIAGAVFSAATP